MRVISNQENKTHLTEINNLLDKADEVIFCVAFLKNSGLFSLTEKLKAKERKCTFFIGTDFYLTEPTALRKLFEDGHSVYITKKEKATYHPKIFYFKKAERINLVIGSSNLTSGGLETNIEASFSVETIQNSAVDLDFKKLIANLRNHSILIENNKPISEYETRYSAYRNRHKQADMDFENDLLEILELERQQEEAELLRLQNLKTKSTSNKNSVVKISSDDYANFAINLDKYIDYTTNTRKATAVNKNHSDKDLVKWYTRMKELIKHEALPDDLAMQLIDANFPFDNAWGGTIKMMWDKNFKELLAFKEKEQKHLDYTYVLQTKKPDSPYFDLGRWIAQQKQRRKGQHGSAWTDYEEQKMQSINYIWDRPELGGEADDDSWWSSLMELQKYYSEKRNFKTVPSQKTSLGRWVNDQLTLKNTGIVQKGKERRFLNKLRTDLLGELLKKNGVEWKWQQQKERDLILEGLKGWQELVKWEAELGNRKPTSAEVKYFKKIREWKASTRNRSKKWDREKESWKIELLTKAGFPLPKIDELDENQNASS